MEIPDQVGNENRGEIVLYQPEGEVRLEVRVENETVWLTQAQMAELFEVQRQAITKHIKNIFDTHELDVPSTSSILELVQKEGRRMVKRPVTLYNLDMIISVGFRVNTQRGIKFRRWANQVLKEYMLKGYAINQRKLSTDLQIVDHLHEQRQLIEGQGVEIAELRDATEKRLGGNSQGLTVTRVSSCRNGSYLQRTSLIAKSLLTRAIFLFFDRDVGFPSEQSNKVNL